MHPNDQKLDINAVFAPPVVDRPPVALPKARGPVNPYRSEPRVWITLQRGEHIPPTGQYFGYTGEVKQHDGTTHRMHRDFILVPGKPAWVPQGLIDILNNAVEEVPIKNDDDQVVGWEPRLRFAYQPDFRTPPPEDWSQDEVVDVERKAA